MIKLEGKGKYNTRVKHTSSNPHRLKVGSPSLFHRRKLCWTGADFMRRTEGIPRARHGDDGAVPKALVICGTVRNRDLVAARAESCFAVREVRVVRGSRMDCIEAILVYDWVYYCMGVELLSLRIDGDRDGVEVMSVCLAVLTACLKGRTTLLLTIGLDYRMVSTSEQLRVGMPLSNQCRVVFLVST